MGKTIKLKPSTYFVIPSEPMYNSDKTYISGSTKEVIIECLKNLGLNIDKEINISKFIRLYKKRNFPGRKSSDTEFIYIDVKRRKFTNFLKKNISEILDN
jgi:hypothetical protein